LKRNIDANKDNNNKKHSSGRGATGRKDSNNNDDNNNKRPSNETLPESAMRKRRSLLVIIAVAVALVIGGGVALSVFIQKMPEDKPQQDDSTSAMTVIDGIPCDSTEHTVYHTHAHLDIFVNGQSYTVPGGIGIDPSAKCLFWLHTHTADGVIHMESPENRMMTLGNFLDIWQHTSVNVKDFAIPPYSLTSITADAASKPTVYINGEKIQNMSKAGENYKNAQIFPNTEIAIVYGSEIPASKIPSTYVAGKTDIKIDSSNADLLRRVLSPSTSASGPLGDPDAPVTIVEFGDYQCNSCGVFYRATKDALMTNLVDTGKAKFMFKDYTLNDYILQPIQGSTLAAEAAYCAGDQGKFWQYHDELYSNQQQEGIVWVSKDSLKKFASNINVSDIEQFSDCLDSHKHLDTVKTNNELVNKLGINATPTFIIIPTTGENNPVKLVGAYPYQSFEAVIKQLES